jgi:hypothetical protein
MESGPGKMSFPGKGEVLTFTAFLALLGNVGATGLPGERLESIKSDYTELNRALEDKPHTEMSHEMRRYTIPEYDNDVTVSKKEDSIKEGSKIYKAEVRYENRQPIQYRFSVVENGIQIETIDGGEGILVPDKQERSTVSDTLSNSTIFQREVIGGQPAHMEVTRPDGVPDRMIMTFKNGDRYFLVNKNGKWEVVAGDQVKVKPTFTKPDTDILVQRALSTHNLVRLKFETKVAGKSSVAER